MTWKSRILTWGMWCGLMGLGMPSLHGVEISKPITDREIIESLAELKAGQKNLEKNMDQRFEQVNQRFEQIQNSMDQRFEQVNQRFEQIQNSMDQRFEQVNQRFEQLQTTMAQRFEQMSQRFTFLENLVMVLIAGILGLIGFVVWDRKTALRPLEKKLDRLEQDLQHDLELQRPDGSRLTRLIHALGELARHDPKVAETLKAFSLL